MTNLTAAAGKLFFTAFDPSGGTDLWVSGGTPGSTIVLDDFDSSSAYGYYSLAHHRLDRGRGQALLHGQQRVRRAPALGKRRDHERDRDARRCRSRHRRVRHRPEFTELGGDVYFFMNESSTTVGLWESNGTTAGTAKVFDAFPSLTVGAKGYAPTLANLTAIGSTLFFSLEYNTTTPQYQLWTSNGTASGTSQLKPSSLPSGSTFREMQNFVPLGSLLVFTADDGTDAQLWKSDGTAAGTTVIADNGPTIGNYSYNGLLRRVPDGRQRWHPLFRRRHTRQMSSSGRPMGPRRAPRWSPTSAPPRMRRTRCRCRS